MTSKFGRHRSTRSSVIARTARQTDTHTHGWSQYLLRGAPKHLDTVKRRSRDESHETVDFMKWATVGEWPRSYILICLLGTTDGPSKDWLERASDFKQNVLTACYSCIYLSSVFCLSLLTLLWTLFSEINDWIGNTCNYKWFLRLLALCVSLLASSDFIYHMICLIVFCLFV